MQRGLWSFVLCGVGVAGFGGCAHSLETRIISSYIQNLKETDVDKLSEASSDDFKASALRHKEAADAIKLLNLPAGEVKVVEVTDETPTTKKVLVEVGEKKRKLYFKLLKDDKANRWVVDDIVIKKRLKPGQVNKTVTEQMDLLLSVEEFLDAWSTGKRPEILAVSTPELGQVLDPLPNSALVRFSKALTTDLNRDDLKPEIEGHANTVSVVLRRKVGAVLLTMRQIDGRWLADDLAVQSKKEGDTIPSLRKQAQVMLSATRFYDAYRKGDHEQLQKLCMSRFYRLNLDGADLAQVPLPDFDVAQGDVEIRLLMTRAEVLMKQDHQIIQLSLTQGMPRLDDEGKPIDDSATSTKPYLIEEVTLHDLNSKQEKRLSALYSSQSMVQVFAKALANRDLKAMRMSATTDFNSRVWKRVELEHLGMLPLEMIESGPVQIIDTQFNGAMTEVTVNQGQTPLTYVLRDQNGALLVDDVLTPALDRPNSLKMTLEVVIPLQTFTDAMENRNVDLARSNSSREFNKLVFQSMDHIPDLKVDPSPFLSEPISRIQLTTDRALLILGTEKYGAKVFMNKEGEHYVVDDIVLVSGIEQKQRAGLKQALRQLVVGGTQFGSTHLRQPNRLATKSPSSDAEPEDGGIRPVSYEEESTERR